MDFRGLRAGACRIVSMGEPRAEKSLRHLRPNGVVAAEEEDRLATFRIAVSLFHGAEYTRASAALGPGWKRAV